MIKRGLIFLSGALIAVLAGCSHKGATSSPNNVADLTDSITSVISVLDARVGVAVIINDTDTIEVNGNRDFPMMSVFKFPIALAVAEYVDRNDQSLSDTISIGREELTADTYSPMLDKYGMRDMELPLREILEWSLMESDNNACDILMDRIGGVDSTMAILGKLGINDDITIGVNERHMHDDNYLSYLNRSTPTAMASLFNEFDRIIRYRSESFDEIGLIMEQCLTGTDRLKAALDDDRIVVGHKTGTGFMTKDGRLMALNDCGYVHLPDGQRYAIAVFVADSAYDMDATSAIIARISAIVYQFLKSHA